MFISDHASPIASPGSTDCGGQNVYVAEVAASLISMGYCVDVFTRKDYRDIVIESIKHCQDKKGLILHAWCIMSNHLHLIVSAKNKDLSDILRDFKKLPANKS